MVVALVGGQPVPLFTGAVPEQQVREVFAQLLQLAAQNGVTGSIDVSGEQDATDGCRTRGTGTAAAARRGLRRDRGGRLRARDRGLREGTRREPARRRGPGRPRSGEAAGSRAGPRSPGGPRCRGGRAARHRRAVRRSRSRSGRAVTSTTRSRACSICSRLCRPTNAPPCASVCSSCSRSSATPTRASSARGGASRRCCSEAAGRQGSSSRPVLACEGRCACGSC